MFTEIDLETCIENGFDDIINRSLQILCSDSMEILQNNSKVLKYLTDAEKELGMLVKSIGMAIKRGRFELLQNIISGMKNDIYKLAALEIRYFDDNETLLRSDIYNKFMPENFKKHAFVTPELKEILDLFNKTAILSPTNASFAVKTSLETGEQNFIENVLLNACLSDEFIKQTNKRYYANFGMPIVEDIEKLNKKSGRNDVIKNLFKKAV